MVTLKRSLRAKVTVGIVLPLLLILGILAYLEHNRRNATTQDNLSMLASYSGKVVESNLRHAMLKDDFTEVRTLLDTIGSREEFQIVYVIDTSGEVIFAPNDDGIGTRLDLKHPDCQLCHSMPPEERPDSVVLTTDDGQRIFRSMYPLENQPECAECHGSDERLLGLLLTDLTMEPMETALTADLRENAMWWLGAIFVTIVVVNIAINRFVLRRLESLASAIAGLGQGRLPQPLPEDEPDEIGQLASAFNLMAQQIELRNQENRELSDSLRHESAQRGELLKHLISAQENERTRVARELHDELGQSLSGLALCTEVMERFVKADPDKAQSQLAQIRSLIAETTDQMYELILDLRPSALDDLGLVVALHGHAERTLGHANIEFEFAASGISERLPPEIETALYRIFQETLNNIVRHSRATHVSLKLQRQNGCVEGIITDNGIGFNPGAVRMDGSAMRGLGLMGIQERVVQCRGQVDIISEPGQGTRVAICIPLEKDMPCD